MKRHVMMRLAQFFLGMLCVGMVSLAFAQSTTSEDVPTLVNKIETGVLLPLLNVIVAISYIAGAGFIVASIFKFKAHKDNPTQVTVGTPIMLLFVGIGLLFFPVLIKSISSTVGISSGAGSVTFSGGTVTS